jgi:hypothetical protein
MLPSFSAARAYSIHRLNSNALDLQEELTTFVNPQTYHRNENANRVADHAWIAADTMLPILNTFKSCVELLASERMGTLAQVLEVEILI